MHTFDNNQNEMYNNFSNMNNIYNYYNANVMDYKNNYNMIGNRTERHNQ